MTKEKVDMEEFLRIKLLLSNCAYWAINALGVKGSLEHVNEIQKVSLRNILNVSKEFIICEPDVDTIVTHEGVSASLVPEEGWPEPKKEWINIQN